MDKRTNTGSGWYTYGTVVAAAPTTKQHPHYHHASQWQASKPKQQKQQQQQLNKTTARTSAGGNSSPQLAATFQGMSVNVLQQQQQSASSGVHSWPSARQDEQAALQATVAAARSKQAAAQTQQTTNTNTTPINQYKQQSSSNNNNNISNNNNAKLQKPLPAIEQQPSAGNRTKPRNKSEEAISDLLQRIPDIGKIFDVHSRIGNGTFSTVLLATLKREAQLPDSMRRKFAIKHHIPTSHPDRIMKELQCMTDMGGTDNVVGIHCCLRCEASAAFVMPYMAHDRFHDFYMKMDVPEIRLYMRNLLLALRHVHKFNIIHRDVKPSNFLYNRRQGQFLLVDFGLAQHVNVNVSSAAATVNLSSTQQTQTQIQTQAQAQDQRCKRPRERDVNVLGHHQQQQSAASVAVTDAALGGAVKRMRLIDETTASGWNKLPLKPANEIAQSAKCAELLLDDPKQNMQNAAAADVQSTGATGAMQSLQAQTPELQYPQQQTTSSTNNKYNTNRTGGNNTKCFCFANPSVCLNCLMKKEVHASRAGTPGYRPPEVLLKYADQTTAVDVWAAGVIFLSILSSVYPFFKAPNDFVALAEIVTIFGDRAIRKTALALERMVTIGQRSKPLNLRKLCLRFRHRLIFSDAQMIKKHESPDGRCDVCRNCDQYFFNCLCEESDYVTEPLEPYECFSPSAYDLLSRLLEINPHNRISAEEALNHPFFTEQPTVATVGTVAATATAVLPRNVRAESFKHTTTRRRATKAGTGTGIATTAITTPTGAGAAGYGAATIEEQLMLQPTLHKL